MKRSSIARGTTGLARSPMPYGIASLKRTALVASSTSIARSPFPSTGGQLLRKIIVSRTMTDGTATVPRQCRLRTRGPKMTPIRRSAKGEDCTLNFAGICRNNTDTTVWCHSNRLIDGKGMGIKAKDEAGCYGCAQCHAFLDGGWASFPDWTYDLVQDHFEVARAKSRPILKHKGLIADEYSK